MNGSANELVENPVYQSLTRPKLFRGAEPKYSMMSHMFAFYLGCKVIMSHDWWLILGVLFFLGPVPWLLRWFAKDDPLKLSLYFEAIKEPDMWEPY